MALGLRKKIGKVTKYTIAKLKVFKKAKQKKQAWSAQTHKKFKKILIRKKTANRTTVNHDLEERRTNAIARRNKLHK